MGRSRHRRDEVSHVVFYLFHGKDYRAGVSGSRRSLWNGPLAGCAIIAPHIRRSCRSCCNAYMRAARRAGRYNYGYSQKERARATLKVGVRRGKIIRTPCAECGGQKVEGHHTDYAKPLQVVWLCRRCHRLRHHQASPDLPRKPLPTT